MSMYTEQEVTNRKVNNVEQIRTIIISSMELAKLLKPFDFGEYNKGLKIAEEMIVRGFCTIRMAHMDESDFEELVNNTLAYFATGLYDCEKISGFGFHLQICPVKAWVYTPDTHNDAGEWFEIYTFKKINDAIKCAAMLKAIGAELEKLNNN